MVNELGHVGEQVKNRSIGIRDIQKQGGVAGNSHNIRHSGVNNVNKPIGNIAKNYMDATERESWPSDFNHLSRRFPTSLDTPQGLQNFNRQELQDANPHIVSRNLKSSHSSLSQLLVPPPSRGCGSLYSPGNCMNLGYNRDNSASVNIYNPGVCGGSALNDYSQNAGCDGSNLISPLGVSDIELITSPEQVSSITACSYGDMLSDTEAFDSRDQRGRALQSTSFQQQPFHKSEYRSCSEKLRTTRNMDFPSLSVDDVQSPYSNSCNVQQNFQNNSQANDSLHLQASESAHHVFQVQVLSSYAMYKDMPADLRREVSFQDYMHSAECKDSVCNCTLYLELASHFDKCIDFNCQMCGPVRHLCTANGDFHLETRKRKNDLSDATYDEDPRSAGTSSDALPKKYPKLESSTVGVRFPQKQSPEAIEHNEDVQEVQTSCIGATVNPTVSSATGEDAMDDDRRSDHVYTPCEQESMELKRSNDITNFVMNKSPPLTTDHLPVKKRRSGSNQTEFGQVGIIDESSGLKSAPDACESGMDSKNMGSEVETVKIQSVSLAAFFTAAQIRQYLSSFTTPKDVSETSVHSIGHNTCQLCSSDKLVFAPAPIYCSSCDTRIKRNVGYYRSTNEDGIRHWFCMSCYKGSHGTIIIVRGVSIPKANLQKAKNDEEKEDSWVLCDKCQCWQHRICGLYNDEKDVEGKAEYICPKCYLEELETGMCVPLPPNTASEAKDLPRTNLSDHIEKRLAMRLRQEREEMAKISGIEPEEVDGAEDLVVRVVVSVEKRLDVKQKFVDILHGEDYPSGFTYRSKLIFLFQKIEGVDVCLFGMCVQEFGSECDGPNKRCVYISYLDSVKYFRPERKTATGESLRTFVYHEILIGYLEYCKKRGFATCYIWACPLIKGEDYIFYCHPESQRTPKQDKLRQWYKSMLKKAAEDNVVVDYTNLYNQFFVSSGQGNGKITAARLPYFDGDYWSGAAENIVTKLEAEENAGGLQSKLPNKRILKAMGQDKADVAIKDVLVMQKLGQTILPVKENFMIVNLQHVCTLCHEAILSGSRWFCSHCRKIQLCSRCYNGDKSSWSKMHSCHSGQKSQLSEVLVNDVTVDTKDEDGVFGNSFFETRDAFLNKCQKSHFQFDTLGRAKYSSMMILYHLIHKPVNKCTCTACHKDVLVEECWQCDTCTKYYICKSCYKMKRGGYHPHMLNPPLMEGTWGSKNEKVQKQKALSLKAVLDVLMHASRCESLPCSYPKCTIMRRLFYHARKCSVRYIGGCDYCQRVWIILKEHSQICRDPDCRIPRCTDIKIFKEKCANQQLMLKDRREVGQIRVG